MTAVSQRIPNFLGGVSQQSDEKIFPGQVKDALNCYPDPTLGMIKRPGGRFLGKLENLTASTSDSAAWFTIPIDSTTKFVAAVSTAGVLKVWNLLTGKAATITYPAGKQASIESYLTAVDYRSIKSLVVNDFTYIVNTEKQVTAQSTPTFNANRQATIVLNTVANDTRYRVTIGTTNYDYTTAATGVISVDTVMTGILGAIPAVGGNLVSKTIIGNTIYLTFGSNTKVSTEAGLTGVYITSYQDAVETYTKLPTQAKNGVVVEVANSGTSSSAYYLKFVANDGTSGPGFWQETVAPDVSTGINEATMPVALIKTGALAFTLTFLDGSTSLNGLTLQWEPRRVGDDTTNSQPSFVGSTIQDIFLFSNRIGFLTDDNVSMSQAGDFYNFYNRSALTQTVSDPIDLSVASTRPATIHSVIPITQGLLLFSNDQQFIMESENGAFTPTSVSIRTISNYDCDKYIKPIDLGSTVMYISKNSSWTRAFEIFTRGQRESPTVNESSKVVPEWIPQSITHASGSSQNGLWVASAKTSNILYLFRFYNQADQRALASWVRWSMPSNVMVTSIQNDILFVLTSGAEGYNISQYSLINEGTTGKLINSAGRFVDPHLDTWCEVTDSAMLSPLPPTAPSYSASNDRTTVYLPTYFHSGKVIRYVVGLPINNSSDECGYTNIANIVTVGGNKLFYIPGDVTGNYIYVGYQYNMELVLPRYYYSLGEQGTDFTGITRTARMSFYTGLGGDIYFSLRDNMRPTWIDVTGNAVAESYELGSSPFRDYYIYKMPIHQRPDNYEMKVTSNTPFPVSLVALMWEGQYSPKFYRKG